MAVKDSFSTRLRLVREKSGLSQSELADKLGVSRGSISYYENADRVADIEFLYRLRQYFDLETDYLLGISDNAFLENQELGAKTGLSDKAIHKISNGDIDKVFFNYLVEHDRFDNFMALLADYAAGCYEAQDTKSIDDMDYVTFLATQVLLEIITGISKEFRCNQVSDKTRQGRPYDVVLNDYLTKPVKQRELIIKAFDESTDLEFDKNDDIAIRKKVKDSIIGQP